MILRFDRFHGSMDFVLEIQIDDPLSAPPLEQISAFADHYPKSGKHAMIPMLLYAQDGSMGSATRS